MTAARDVMRGLVSEAEWQAVVVATAKAHGWTCVHQLRSQGTEPGWPDLVLIRPPDLLFVELKNERGVLSPAQRRMLDLLRLCGAEVIVARPSDERELVARLERRRHVAEPRNS